MIKKNTDILLFRYSEYKKYDFIMEHKTIIDSNGYVWMLKSGRKSNEKKIKEIIEQGGWMVLKQPKNLGGNYYLGKFEEISENEPNEKLYPKYYSEFIKESFANMQWFKLTRIEKMDDRDVKKLILCKNGNHVIDVIGNTMTSVMFVKCEDSITD